ncbi:diguanylate cyclase [Glaciecola sp. MH2013]|uniref:GGDEF domain-containing response regulator n=1 Tax=Glaciecola sp. MH2013 TaxID=2785524 RepID=UPI00189DD928|nr:diguanylate cyclase [Glaciecola sp. MH2013]MBF7071948.1 diguanylate cyclase [Glaciecola sp. MH2013]
MKYKVLLIEHDSANLRVLKRVIGKAKLDVVSATTLTQARAIFSSTPPESYLCAVVDYQLPDAKNGQAIDFALDAFVPTIVITNSTEDDVREHILSKAVIDYIPKQNAQIYEYLSRLLTRLQRNKNIGVLVADSSRRSRKNMVDLLKRHNFETHEVAKPELAIDYLHAHPTIKLMIIDAQFGTATAELAGVDVVAETRKAFDKDSLSIIGSSDEHSPTILARFLKCGADDYLKKPYCHEEFFVRVMQNIEYVEQIALIRKTANADYLTGLPNRRHFFSQAKERMQRGLEYKTLALMDLDHFKSINDNYGHDHGDLVLKEFSKLLDKHFGKYCISRFGGEEFCVFMPDLPQHAALVLLDEFREALSLKTIVRKNVSVQCTVSIGVTSKFKRKIESMLVFADENLYLAKEGGRNRVIGDTS